MTDMTTLLAANLVLGRTPVKTDEPIRFVYKPEIQNHYYDTPHGLEFYAASLVSETFLIYIGKKLYATTSRGILKRNRETGQLTIRLFKNKTQLAV